MKDRGASYVDGSYRTKTPADLRNRPAGLRTGKTAARRSAGFSRGGRDKSVREFKSAVTEDEKAEAKQIAQAEQKTETVAK